MNASLPALTLLLQALAGRDAQVQALAGTPPEGAAPRPILSDRHLLLPAAAWPVQRAAVAHAAAHLLHSPAHQPTTGLKPLGLAVVAAIEDARVEQLLQGMLPGVRGWFLDLLRQAVQPTALSADGLLSRLDLALLDDDYADGNHWVDKARTGFAAIRRQHGLEDYAAFRRLGAILANDLGQMRVRFEPRQYAVPAPYRDDNSYLWQHGATQTSASELLLHTPPPPARGDAAPGDTPPAPAAEAHTPCHLYPEWDYRLQHERPDWCTVREQRPPRPPGTGSTPPAFGRLLPLARARRLSRAQRLRRQWEGEEIDLDAAIDAAVARRLRQVPEGRLFQRPGHGPCTASVLLLLDLSASTLDRAAGSAQTLLALEQQAALLLARSALAGGDRIAIHGFSSDTRARVSYFRLLDFGAPLDAAAGARITNVGAAHSTRMGAALRHAAGLLAAEDTALRTIVVLTDGAPSDVDVFDRHYLVEDAQAAVRQARQQGVQTSCLAVDPGADAWVRRIFGWRNYRIVASAAQLPTQLVDLYARLTAG